MDLFLFIYKGDITLEEFKYLIPEESNDATRMDASLMRTIEGHLRRTFNAHEYQELLLPTFEYADLLSGFGTNEETMYCSYL